MEELVLMGLTNILVPVLQRLMESNVKVFTIAYMKNNLREERHSASMSAENGKAF